jgi:hypothetical protein
MGTSRPTRGVTLDAGALIALEHGSGRMIALVDEIARAGGEAYAYVPAGALAQAWRGGRQARIARLLRSSRSRVVPLDEPRARAAGALLALAGTSDVVDATVVLCAREYAVAVVSSDRDDLVALDPALPVFAP